MPWDDIGRINQPIVDRAWRRVLREWLRWDGARIDSWLEVFGPEIRDEVASFFYHDPIMTFIVGLFIVDEVADRLRTQQSMKAPHELMALDRRLLQVFEGSAADRSVWDDDFDWPQARKRIDAILAEFGTSLPGPEVVTALERRCRERPLTAKVSLA
jgi:hypothetical protein